MRRWRRRQQRPPQLRRARRHRAASLASSGTWAWTCRAVTSRLQTTTPPRWAAIKQTIFQTPSPIRTAILSCSRTFWINWTLPTWPIRSPRQTDSKFLSFMLLLSWSCQTFRLIYFCVCTRTNTAMNPFFRTNSAMPTSSQQQQQQQQQQQLSNLIQQQQQQLQQQQKKLAGLMELNSYFIQFWLFIILISTATLFAT